MDAQPLSHIKGLLEAERDRLEAQLHALDDTERQSLSEASGENVYRDHMGDQGSATFERELDMTIEENLRLELRDVREALARIEDGSYGTCLRCASEIPYARLEAMPRAKLCIGCKEAEESR